MPLLIRSAVGSRFARSVACLSLDDRKKFLLYIYVAGSDLYSMELYICLGGISKPLFVYAVPLAFVEYDAELNVLGSSVSKYLLCKCIFSVFGPRDRLDMLVFNARFHRCVDSRFHSVRYRMVQNGKATIQCSMFGPQVISYYRKIGQ